MATYIIIKNIRENSINFGKIKKIELTKKGGGEFMEAHALVRKECDNGFFALSPEVVADRKKHNMATVTVFKNGKRFDLGFDYTIQIKKIGVNSVFLDDVSDSCCPHCGSDEIDYDGDRSFGDGEANQEVNCPVCDCHWINVYKFNGVQIIN